MGPPDTMKSFCRYLLLVLLPSCGLRAAAQKTEHVMDWKTDATLNTYLLQQMHNQYAARQIVFQKALRSPADAAAYSAGIRRRFRSLLGTMPGRSPLNAAITGRIQRDGYHIEKIAYESFPHHHVTANLYVPEGKGPFAAALLFCGHEDQSKATESYQKTAQLFAKNGFVVFVIDPISQSERYQLVGTDGQLLTRGGTTEHTLLNEAANLLGGSAPADELWDNARGLDYLVTRREVDTTRIGCLGNSGGGMQTIYFAAFDPRIKIMAPCSYLATRERTLELGGPADGCAQIPGEGAAGLELNDFLMAAAPKPLLVLAGRYDFIDYTGVVTAFGELKKFYTTLGHPAQVELFTYEDGHGISQPKREAAVTWFRRWLYEDPRPVHEGSLATLTVQDLQVTPKGQVSASYPDEVSLAQRNRQAYDELASARKTFQQHYPEKKESILRRLLSLDDTAGTVRIELTGTNTRNSISYQRMILRRGAQMPLPAALLLPAQAPSKLIIWLPGAGRNKLLDSTALLQSYLASDAAVLIADLRGLGETEDRSEFNDPKFYNREYRNDMLALHVGRNLVGQRTADIQTLFDLAAADQRLSRLPIEVYASGGAAVPALHAACLWRGVSHWTLQLPLRSYREVFERPTAKDWYMNLVPGALSYYDLPDLVQMAGANKITLQ